MTTIRVQRQASGRFEPRPGSGAGCTACPGCGRSTDPLALSIALADVSSNEADLVLAPRALLKLLLNSWFLPLLAMLGAAITCRFFGITESWTIALSALGFVIGLSGCRTQSQKLVDIVEVT